MTKLFASNEIVAASLLADCGQDELRAFQNDPKAFLLANADVDIADAINIGFADNDANTVHLALPYYSALQTASSQQLSEDELGDVVGGELFATVAGVASGVVKAGADEVNRQNEEATPLLGQDVAIAAGRVVGIAGGHAGTSAVSGQGRPSGASK